MVSEKPVSIALNYETELSPSQLALHRNHAVTIFVREHERITDLYLFDLFYIEFLLCHN